MKKFLSKLFIISGAILLLVSSYFFYLRYSSHPLTFKSKPQTVVSGSRELPKSILIPSIKVNLPLIASSVHDRNWETTNIGVSFLKTTPVPGQKGNSVLYGHNWKSILGDLPKVKPGQKIIITMSDGVKKEFKIEYTAIVDPTQTYIIDNTKDSRITLYTCVGFLDSKRFVVVAFPTS